MIDHLVMDVSDVVATASHGTGTVHNMVVGQVLPMITGSMRSEVKYFDGDGQFSDGVKVQLVWFEST